MFFIEPFFHLRQYFIYKNFKVEFHLLRSLLVTLKNEMIRHLQEKLRKLEDERASDDLNMASLDQPRVAPTRKLRYRQGDTRQAEQGQSVFFFFICNK